MRKSQLLKLMIPLRLIVWFCLVLHNQFKVKATETGLSLPSKMHSELDELNLKDRIKAIEDQNWRQENEIGHLKTNADQDRKRINQLESRLAQLEAVQIDSGPFVRSKRPYRLLPSFKGENRDKIELESRNDEVNVEVIYCKFQQPQQEFQKKGVEEKRLGYIGLSRTLSLTTYNAVTTKDHGKISSIQTTTQQTQNDKEKIPKPSSVIINTGTSTPQLEHEDQNDQLHDPISRNVTTSTAFQSNKILSSMTLTKKVPLYCSSNSTNQLFHLKNEWQNICMGIKDGTQYQLTLRKCDNSSSVLWFKDPVPEHAKTNGATQLQHTSGDKLLAVHLKSSDGVYGITVRPFHQNQRNQQWKMIQTGQFKNVEAQLCMTINSKSLPNKSTKLSYGMKYCNNNKQEILAKQKWSVVPLPNCAKS